MEPAGRDELVAAIVAATRAAISSLFTNHPGHYYYIALVTTGEAHCPLLSAWSEEALADAVARSSDPVVAESELKWSYADSPFCSHGQEHFGAVRALFGRRPTMDPFGPSEAWRAEWLMRVEAMTASLAQLDHEGLFGSVPERHRVFINVEVAPPDDTNAERAVLLNPPEASLPWLKVWAQP